MQGKACVFVDGENLRHSLVDVFAAEGIFKSDDYLPAKAKWSDFFDWLVAAATADSAHRLRAYWFVSQDLDCFPYNLEVLGNAQNRSKLKNTLCRCREFDEQLQGLKGEELDQSMRLILRQLLDAQLAIDSRFKSWIAIQNRIALTQRAVEFRRAGAISFNLFDRRFGQEKAVDVKLACDMIMLRDIYDTAIIVSGDQDYVPAAQVLKDAGKTVINVAFEKRNGALLPGGARRLNIVTDASLNVPYLKLRELMGLGLDAAAADLAA
jgi:uncharacterized LabA/DUF88 family protein